MDPGIELIASAVMGYAVTWARAYKAVNNWIAWVGVGGVAAGMWIWMTPNALSMFHTNWRNSLASIVTFALSSKGAGSMLKDAKAAPQTDSK